MAKGSEKYNTYEDDWGGGLHCTSGLKSPPKGASRRNPKGKSTKDSAAGNSSKATDSDKITKNKKPTGDRQRQKKDEAWKKVPPKDRARHSKTVNDWECM